ncbi:MAG: hypothetical protein HKL92_10690 [Candidatus Eremiobacteraeota bacterium]|nr:hypothetical protein [Candidatus Eremiobacteraeota bacterium]
MHRRTLPIWVLPGIALLGAAAGLLFAGPVGAAFAPAALHYIVPPLLFEAAWNLDLEAVRRAWRPVAILVLPGVAIAALCVAGALLLLSFPWPLAWTVGAALSATDPVAVIAFARSVGAPTRLVAIVEAESLFNDAFAVALVRASNLALSAVAALLGALAGDLLGRLACWLRMRNACALWALSVLGVYAVGAAADAFGGSGIVAVVTLGMFMRTRIEKTIDEGTLDRAEAYWRWAAVALNFVLFAWMGASFNLLDARTALLGAGLVVLALAAARLVTAMGLLRVLPELSEARRRFIATAGVRGALSLALVFTIDVHLPGAQSARAIVFVAVLATMLVGVVALPRSARKLLASGT